LAFSPLTASYVEAVSTFRHTPATELCLVTNRTVPKQNSDMIFKNVCLAFKVFYLPTDAQ